MSILHAQPAPHLTVGTRSTIRGCDAPLIATFRGDPTRVCRCIPSRLVHYRSARAYTRVLKVARTIAR
jgi:hypothetical protein